MLKKLLASQQNGKNHCYWINRIEQWRDLDICFTKFNGGISNWSKISDDGHTAQKMKFSIKDLFSKCDQIRRKLCSVNYNQKVKSFNIMEINWQWLWQMCSRNKRSQIGKQLVDSKTTYSGKINRKYRYSHKIRKLTNLLLLLLVLFISLI